MSIHQILVNALGGKCSLCGSTEKLQIHHVDKNRENSELSNLSLLCYSCHLKEHGKTHFTEPTITTSFWIDKDTWYEFKLNCKELRIPVQQKLNDLIRADLKRCVLVVEEVKQIQ